MKEYINLYDAHGRSLGATKDWQRVPDAFDYIIFKDGDVVKAKNGRTGKIEFKSDTFNSILSQLALSEVHKIKVTGGVYDVTDTFKFQSLSNLTIEGEEDGSTVLRRVYEGNLVYFWWVENCSDIVIKNFVLDGRCAFYSDTKAAGVYIKNSSNVTIKNVSIKDVQYGISAHDSATLNIEKVNVDKVVPSDYSRGIFLNKCDEVNVTNCKLTNIDTDNSPVIFDYHCKRASIINNIIDNTTGNAGIQIYSSTDEGKSMHIVALNKILNVTNYNGIFIYNTTETPSPEDVVIVALNTIENCNGAGIEAQAPFVIVLGNTVNSVGGSGLYVSSYTKNSIFALNKIYNASPGIHITPSAEYVDVSHNSVDNCSQGLKFYCSDYVYSKNINIEGNQFSNCDYGVYNNANADYDKSVVFAHNIFSNISEEVFYNFIETATYIKNIDLVTENSGTATFSGDGSTTQFKIEHGLVSTPSKVLVTPMSADAAGEFYVTVDDTYIYVNYSSAPASGTDNVKLSWYAEV